MPEFDTRRPQEQNVPNEPRTGLVANKLRSALMATRLRTLLIGGGILLFVVAVPVGLLIYSPSWLGDQNQGSSQGSGQREVGSSQQQQSEPTTNETLVRRCADSGSTVGQQEEAGRGDVSNGKIVFTRSTAVASDIYVVDEGGAHETRLTYTKKFEGDPIWSPDGQKIAYSTSPYNALYVMNADGTNRTRLPGDAMAGRSLPGDVMAGRGVPAWSPDGQKIAFVDFWGELYVINADGTNEARLTTLFSGSSEDRTQLGSPAWSPDGKRIAFARGTIPDTSTVSPDSSTEAASAEAASALAEELTGIYLINVDGTGLCKLTSGEAPLWSPDGEQIAFYDFGTINVINADGSGRKELTAGTSAPPQLAWSPDGKRIAFIDVSSELNVINADGSGRRSLTKAPGVSYAAFPTWSPDSEKLAFSCPFDVAQKSRHTDLCVINADGTGLKRIATKLNPEAFPVTSSWGRKQR